MTKKRGFAVPHNETTSTAQISVHPAGLCGEEDLSPRIKRSLASSRYRTHAGARLQAVPACRWCRTPIVMPSCKCSFMAMAYVGYPPFRGGGESGRRSGEIPGEVFPRSSRAFLLPSLMPPRYPISDAPSFLGISGQAIYAAHSSTRRGTAADERADDNGARPAGRSPSTSPSTPKRRAPPPRSMPPPFPAPSHVCIGPSPGRSLAARPSRPVRRCALRARPHGWLLSVTLLGGRSALRIGVEGSQVRTQSSNPAPNSPSSCCHPLCLPPPPHPRYHRVHHHRHQRPRLDDPHPRGRRRRRHRHLPLLHRPLPPPKRGARCVRKNRTHCTVALGSAGKPPTRLALAAAPHQPSPRATP